MDHVGSMNPTVVAYNSAVKFDLPASYVLFQNTLYVSHVCGMSKVRGNQLQ